MLDRPAAGMTGNIDYWSVSDYKSSSSSFLFGRRFDFFVVLLWA